MINGWFFKANQLVEASKRLVDISLIQKFNSKNALIGLVGNFLKRLMKVFKVWPWDNANKSAKNTTF